MCACDDAAGCGWEWTAQYVVIWKIQQFRNQDQGFLNVTFTGPLNSGLEGNADSIEILIYDFRWDNSTVSFATDNSKGMHEIIMEFVESRFAEEGDQCIARRCDPSAAEQFGAIMNAFFPVDGRYLELLAPARNIEDAFLPASAHQKSEKGRSAWGNSITSSPSHAHLPSEANLATISQNSPSSSSLSAFLPIWGVLLGLVISKRIFSHRRK